MLTCSRTVRRLVAAATRCGRAAAFTACLVVPPLGGLAVATAGAQAPAYPEGMSAAERRRYYDAYNASRTPAQWDSLRRAAAAARTVPVGATAATTAPAVAAPTGVPAPTASPAGHAGEEGPGARERATVVAFRMRNRGLWPTKVEVAGNVLDFGPFETRYVQFPPGSRVYAYDARQPGGRARLLFTVARADEGRLFGVSR